MEVEASQADLETMLVQNRPLRIEAIDRSTMFVVGSEPNSSHCYREVDGQVVWSANISGRDHSRQLAALFDVFTSRPVVFWSFDPSRTFSFGRP